MGQVKTNKELLEDFLQDIELQGWSKGAKSSSKYTLGIYMDFLGKKSCINADLNTLKQFYVIMKERPGQYGRERLSEGSIKKYVSNLGSFYEFLYLEKYIDRNPVPEFRKRYLRKLKNNYSESEDKRQLISIVEMAKMINTVFDPKEKAILLVLAKTGVRATELLNMDVDDINWTDGIIKLKPTAKRSHLNIFFDDECARALKRWINTRKDLTEPEQKALFISAYGNRLTHPSLNKIVKKHARRMGLHKDEGEIDERLTPHCFRHFFTTHLRRAGMPRDHIKELRGDSRSESMDIYYHIDKEELRASYMTYIPTFGI